MAPITKERIEWIDIARGVAMLIVVIGHSGASWVNPYISWLQMPLFFFLGGLVFKNARDKNVGNLKWSLHKIRLMVVPYVVFGLLTYLVFRELNPALLPSKQNLLFGGVRLQGIYGVYWFITVYLATILVFNLVSQLPKRQYQIITVGVMYALGHVLFMTSDTLRPIMWNLDVVLISTTYFAMGYYLRSYVYLLEKASTFLAAFAFVGTCVFLQMNEIINLEMDMKYKQFTNPVLDFFVPLSCIVIVLSVVHASASFLGVFKYFGVASLYIMYMHIPLNVALHTRLTFSTHPALFVIIGMAIPTIVYYGVHTVIDAERFQRSRPFSSASAPS